MSARLVGVEALVASLDGAAAALLDLSIPAAAAARIIESAAAAAAPRRTGRMAGTARAAVDAGVAVVTFGSPAVPYAGVIHWGWPARGIAAQPFASTAAQRSEPQWVPVYEEYVQTVLDTVHT